MEPCRPNGRVLAAEIVRTLAASQQSGSAARALPETAPKEFADNIVGEPQLGLNLPDYILDGTPMSVTITQSNVEPAAIAIDVVDLATNTTVRKTIDGAASATVEFTLDPGEYRISATRTKALAGIGALTATDGFAVLDPEEAMND